MAQHVGACPGDARIFTVRQGMALVLVHGRTIQVVSYRSSRLLNSSVSDHRLFEATPHGARGGHGEAQSLSVQAARQRADATTEEIVSKAVQFKDDGRSDVLEVIEIDEPHAGPSEPRTGLIAASGAASQARTATRPRASISS